MDTNTATPNTQAFKPYKGYPNPSTWLIATWFSDPTTPDAAAFTEKLAELPAPLTATTARELALELLGYHWGDNTIATADWDRVAGEWNDMIPEPAPTRLDRIWAARAIATNPDFLTSFVDETAYPRLTEEQLAMDPRDLLDDHSDQAMYEAALADAHPTPHATTPFELTPGEWVLVRDIDGLIASQGFLSEIIDGKLMEHSTRFLVFGTEQTAHLISRLIADPTVDFTAPDWA